MYKNRKIRAGLGSQRRLVYRAGTGRTGLLHHKLRIVSLCKSWHTTDSECTHKCQTILVHVLKMFEFFKKDYFHKASRGCDKFRTLAVVQLTKIISHYKHGASRPVVQKVSLKSRVPTITFRVTLFSFWFGDSDPQCTEPHLSRGRGWSP